MCNRQTDNQPCLLSEEEYKIEYGYELTLTEVGFFLGAGFRKFSSPEENISSRVNSNGISIHMKLT